MLQRISLFKSKGLVSISSINVTENLSSRNFEVIWQTKKSLSKLLLYSLLIIIAGRNFDFSVISEKDNMLK